jgi:hypothetical protein
MQRFASGLARATAAAARPRATAIPRGAALAAAAPSRSVFLKKHEDENDVKSFSIVRRELQVGGFSAAVLSLKIAEAARVVRSPPLVLRFCCLSRATARAAARPVLHLV